MWACHPGLKSIPPRRSKGPPRNGAEHPARGGGSPQGLPAGRELGDSTQAREAAWLSPQRKDGEPRATGGEGETKEARVQGRVRDQLGRTPQGRLTWVLMAGHLLVLRIQRPRRPRLFPQLHVWVPVRRGRDRGQSLQDARLDGGPRGGGTGAMWAPSARLRPSRQEVRGSGDLRAKGEMALCSPTGQGSSPRPHATWVRRKCSGCGHLAGASIPAPPLTSWGRGKRGRPLWSQPLATTRPNPGRFL